MLLALFIIIGALILGSIFSNVNLDVLAAFVVAGGLILLWPIGWHEGWDVISFISSNLFNIIIGIVAWFIVGGLWAMFKWWAYLHDPDTQTKIKEAHNDYLRLKEKNAGFIKETFLSDQSSSSFRPGKNKARITRWIVWWPTSVMWSMTYCLITRLSSWIYDWIVSVLNKITSSEVERAIKKSNIE
jgi:hypothetical protein